MGEFGLIDLLKGMLIERRPKPEAGPPQDFRLLVDIGDDAAAWRPRGDTELYTTDTMVEGVHFTRQTLSWYDLGWKVIAANASDIAAMGGLPSYALVTLGLPMETEVELVKCLYAGMIELANRHGIIIAGGDVVRSPVTFVTVVLTGVAEQECMLRSTARAGDIVAITGYLGSSAGGLRVLQRELSVSDDSAEYLKAAHQRPEPCTQEGLALSRAGVRTAIDISDGLVDDLSKLCTSSGVAAEIDAQKIPMHAALKQVFPDDHLELALSGGEDYQLLFTAPMELMDKVLAALPAPAVAIGGVVEGESGQVSVFDSNTGNKLSIPNKGWDHFRSEKVE